jgi:uncharacterized protein YkwD
MSSIDSAHGRRIAVAVWLAFVVAALGAALTFAAVRPGAAPAAVQRAACELADRPAAELSVEELRKAVVCLINKARAQRRHLGSLSRSRALRKAAQRHTQVIIRTGCFAHRCPGEPGLEDRIRDAGYLDRARNWGYGESTGCAESPAAMVKNWLEISFHRRNLLDRDFREVGIGTAHGGPSRRCEEGFATFTAVFGWREY